MLILAVLALCVGTAFAAEWPEGRSPSQPYVGVPEVDLSQTLGYTMVYPRSGIPARLYCDTLEFYLPREDIKINEGFLTLCDAEGRALARVDFSDETAVGVRKLTEDELEKLMWGSGVCVFARLPKSLEIGGDYYVTMDEKCFTSADGAVFSLAISDPQAWKPVLEGDHGISGLYYSVAPAAAEAEEDRTEYKLLPEKGDSITFDLVLGGDAASAVIFSENDSVWFDAMQYTESGRVTGTVTGEDLNWGVVFLTDSGELLDTVYLGR